jgi:hypothetical protein
MLAAVPSNLVISEAPPLDAVLHAHLHQPGLPRERQVSWLRGLVNALGRPHAGETRLFIKWDSWHILQLPLIREAFPRVPWVFLYREPIEVLVSHERMRGSQMVPGLLDPRVFGPDWAEVPPLPLAEYAARVVARFCEAAVTHVPLAGGRLVNFRELPDAVHGSLAGMLGEYAPEDRARMVAATQRHAKHPSQPYREDSTEKQRAATAQLRELAVRWVAEPYRQLEELRIQQR